MHIVRLKAGREKSLLRQHPWIFSGAVEAVEGDPGIGETVDILDSQGGFLARGAYSPESQIRVRVWTWNPYEVINTDFFRSRLENARALRMATLGEVDALRLVYAESDGLPGLIVDRYKDTLVIQVLSAGAERWREIISDLLLELTKLKRIYERSDVEVRKLEGLNLRKGLVRWNEPPARIQFQENGIDFWVAVSAGHKTGFYLDQRENRLRLRELTQGKEVLDCFAYTGGFTVNALAGGATSVTAIDSSAEALELARENVTLNGLPLDKVEWIEADVFQQLRNFRDRVRKFDLIILDPPKFAQTSSQVQKAARGYKDINLLAFKLLRPGGLLVTFSCSGGVNAELFQSIVAGAALDAGVCAHIVSRLEQSPDHPVALNFPEGAYLKGLVLRIT
jgi:23S rRNA (cytosine1962-C5)-methyltransferase